MPAEYPAPPPPPPGANPAGLVEHFFRHETGRLHGAWLRLVGVVALDNRAFGGGAHIVEKADRDNPSGSIGHVTAVCFSPALGKYIGLALVRGGKARHGTRAFISDPLRGRFGPVEIVSHHMFDPDGSRMHG